jgi:hypothetical protein
MRCSGYCRTVRRRRESHPVYNAVQVCSGADGGTRREDHRIRARRRPSSQQHAGPRRRDADHGRGGRLSGAQARPRGRGRLRPVHADRRGPGRHPRAAIRPRCALCEDPVAGRVDDLAPTIYADGSVSRPATRSRQAAACTATSRINQLPGGVSYSSRRLWQVSSVPPAPHSCLAATGAPARGDWRCCPSAW